MLTEDAVVDAVARFLTQHGWDIQSLAHSTQHGDDIVAVQDSLTLLVEAKGAGSSSRSSARYGQPFTGNQVNTHVAVAVLRAMAWVSGPESVRGALAFPDNRHHRLRVGKVLPALRTLEIGIFWVTEDGGVSLDSPWRLD